MKKISCLALLYLFYSFAFAQKILPEFGKIDLADLKLQSCPFEPDAPAMNLFSIEDVEFKLNYDSKLITENRVRIKIFKEAGYKYASIHIPYFSKRGVSKIKDLTGVVYNLDASGNIVIQKLEKKDFFKEKAEENLAVINFTFPNVKPGSVVEFRYTKVEKNIIDIDPWIIQYEIPTAYASATLITPTSWFVKEKTFGADTIDQKNELLTRGGPDRNKTTYYKENISSFQSEPFMTSYKDNLQKMIFLLRPGTGYYSEAFLSPQNSWKRTGSRFLQSPDYGLQVKKTIPGTERLIDSAKKFSTVAGTIDFIYKEVKKRIPAKVEQTLEAGDIIDAWNNKSGNSTEINLILLNLLDKVNVQSFPLLVSTREHGIIDIDFPSAGQLNGLDVIAVDYNKIYVMDASLKNQSFSSPPLNIMNRKAFLLLPAEMKWVMITDDRPLLKQNTTIQAKINDSGTVEGNAYYTYYDYAKALALDSSEEQEKEDRFFDNKTQGLKIISANQRNAGDDTEPLAEDIAFSYVPQNSNDFYFINPQFLFFRKNNPFTKSARNTDIDFGCNQQINLVFQLTVPSSYEVAEVPKSIIVRAPDTSFIFTRIFSSDSTYIFLKQSFEIKTPIFDRANYSAIKEFFTRAYALMGEEIVLKKKK